MRYNWHHMAWHVQKYGKSPVAAFRSTIETPASHCVVTTNGEARNCQIYFHKPVWEFHTDA